MDRADVALVDPVDRFGKIRSLDIVRSSRPGFSKCFVKTRPHFAGGLLGEGYRGDMLDVLSTRANHLNHATDEGVRLACARTGLNEEVAV